MVIKGVHGDTAPDNTAYYGGISPGRRSYVLGNTYRMLLE